MNLTAERIQLLREDYPMYARMFQKIRPAAGGDTIPFVFNSCQQRFHEALEKQKKEQGFVRHICVKARQIGLSTYTCGRFSHKTAMNKGVYTHILAHDAESTNYLFNMAKRIHKHLPEPLRPSIERSNRTELLFGALESQYRVSTAGAEEGGRGTTPQCLHASEFAYYPDAASLMSGLFQGVANVPGTEIIIESTANGRGNLFYKMAMESINPESFSLYRTFFAPWYWVERYSDNSMGGKPFTLDAEEDEIRQVYGLSWGQLLWRRRKIVGAEYCGDIWRFKREYPICMAEAFITGDNALLKIGDVEAARRRVKAPDSMAAKVLGVDGADSKDRIALVLRQGSVVIWIKKYDPSLTDSMTLAGIIARAIDKEQIDKVFIDVAYGTGTRDRLIELGYRAIVTAIPFGSSAMQNEVYANKRAEMAGMVKEWMSSDMPAIPDDDEFIRDLTVMPDFLVKGSRGLLQLPPKEEIKKDNAGVSTDYFDALMLTFAMPVRSRSQKLLVPSQRTNFESVRVNSPFKSRRLQAKTQGRERQISERYIT